ncbi:MAG: DUF1800 domain-containing protein [Saprospiraceae bacterium]|nr:DUF1800 domain-containing protein [Saprospiraceae bacterium]
MEKIKHLYGRAGFGLSIQEWEKKQYQTVSQAVEGLFAKALSTTAISPPNDPDVEGFLRMSEMEKAERRKKERRLVVLQSAAWIKRMSSDRESALLERMTLFWHGHFACQSKTSTLAGNQLNTIRKHALGNFRELVLAIARDPSMIRFLNNQQNRKQKPNENFARELMELFTIGRGNYTEKDIKEAARAFTGWSSNAKGEFIFRARVHDYGQKTFFGKSGRFDGTDIIDMILERKETAQFIVRKIYRYFVNERINEDHIKQLSEHFYTSDYDIGKLMRKIFLSDWFYEVENRGSKIKSPVDLMAGMMKNLHIEFENELALVFLQRSLGQSLFNPPNVAGWPGNKSWVDNSTLMIRLNLPAYLFNSKEVNFKLKEEFEAKRQNKMTRRLTAKVDLNPIFTQVQGKDVEEQVAYLSAYLLPNSGQPPLPLLKHITRGKSAADTTKLILLGLMSLPEYQMC